MTTEHEPPEWDEAKLKAALNPFQEGGRWWRPMTILHGRGIAGQLDASLGADGVWNVNIERDD